MERVEIRVEGMTCGGCVNSIQNALNQREGVHRATADLENGIVSVDFDPTLIARAALEDAITGAGFDVLA